MRHKHNPWLKYYRLKGLIGVKVLIGLLPALLAQTPMAEVPALTVERAYVRALPPGVEVTAAYLTLRNDTDATLTLVGVTSRLAARAEIHAHRREGGKMMMRPVARIQIPPLGEFEFKPGGYHIMLFGLKTGLVAGNTLPLVLKIAGEGGKQEWEIATVARVKSP